MLTDNALAAQVGDPAPDSALRDQDDHEVWLSTFWRERPTVFVFLRHFG